MNEALLRTLVVLSLMIPAGASAVQVLTNAPNTTAPPDDPGFANIGSVNGATGIYLGDGWVLTARHVGAGTITLGGNPFTAVPGSTVELNNNGVPTMTAQTDLVVFQINGDPGLPSLAIGSTAPVLGQQVVMIGNGVNQNASPTNYDVTVIAGPANDAWAANPLGPVELITSSGGNIIRWGTNNIEFVSQNPNAGLGDVRSFGTRYDDDPMGRPYEAQAVLGDSGSGVFRKNGAIWELVGMTHSVGNVPNYDNIPGASTSAIVGESVTLIADLSFYRSQIVAAMVPEPGSAVLTGAGLLGLLHHGRRRRPSREEPLQSGA